MNRQAFTNVDCHALRARNDDPLAIRNDEEKDI